MHNKGLLLTLVLVLVGAGTWGLSAYATGNGESQQGSPRADLRASWGPPCMGMWRWGPEGASTPPPYPGTLAANSAKYEVSNIENGVVIKVTSDNPDTVTAIQERFADFGNWGPTWGWMHDMCETRWNWHWGHSGESEDGQ